MPKTRKPKPAEVETTAEAAEEALEEAETAATVGDAEEFDAAIEEARTLIAQIQEDIKWLKTEAKSLRDATTPTNSTLNSLSSQVKDLGDRLTELTEKFASLNQPKPSEPAPLEPPKETPHLAAEKKPLPVETPPPEVKNEAAPKGPEIKRNKRFI